jgi:hypothetical protein
VDVISEIKLSSVISVTFCRLILANFTSKVLSLESEQFSLHRSARLPIKSGCGKDVGGCRSVLRTTGMPRARCAKVLGLILKFSIFTQNHVVTL